VIELAGPAGAGKTAVLRTIAARDPAVRAGVRVDRVRGLPAVFWHTLALAPAIVDLLFTDARWLWPGLRHLGRLRALPDAVLRARATASRAILLDEGPVFSLTRLAAFQHAAAGNGWLAREWRGALERSSRLVDIVVVLDAPNAVLAGRIRSRRKAHQIKNATDREIFDFLERYRAAYRETVSRMTASGRTRVVELDAAAPVARLASDVLTVLDGGSARLTPAGAERGR
jgi:shikimate kinase